MVKLINRLTGSEMWVAESRLDDYLAAGHKLAVQDKPKKEPTKAPVKPKKTKK